MTVFSKNILKNNNEEIVLVATLKMPVATCGDWRQGWTTLFYKQRLCSYYFAQKLKQKQNVSA